MASVRPRMASRYWVEENCPGMETIEGPTGYEWMLEQIVCLLMGTRLALIFFISSETI